MNDKPTKQKKKEITAESFLEAVNEEMVTLYNSGSDDHKTVMLAALTIAVRAIDPAVEVLCATRPSGVLVAFIAKS